MKLTLDMLSALKNGRLALVEKLLASEELDINQRDSDGNTPLMIAVEYGYAKLVDQIALHSNADLNIKNKKGDTALTLAIRSKKENIALQLLDFEYININCAGSDGRYSPLLCALIYGFRDLAYELIEHDAIMIGSTDNNGNDELILAVYRGWNDIAVKLLNHPSVNVNTKNNLGITAYLVAKSQSNQELLTKFLQRSDLLYSKTAMSPTEKRRNVCKARIEFSESLDHSDESDCSKYEDSVVASPEQDTSSFTMPLSKDLLICFSGALLGKKNVDSCQERIEFSESLDHSDDSEYNSSSEADTYSMVSGSKQDASTFILPMLKQLQINFDDELPKSISSLNLDDTGSDKPRLSSLK